MKTPLVVPLSILLVVLGGCSTGPFLKPEATGGNYNRENPSCPGALEVFEFRPTSQPWVVFRTLAKLPNRYSPEGTQLIAYFEFQYLLPEPPRMSWSLFPNESEREEKKNLVELRKSRKITISTSSPLATILFPDGSSTQISLPYFESSHDSNQGDQFGVWGPKVLVSPKALDSFTVIFPEIFINGSKLDIPPVKFTVSKGRFTPVLNC